MCFCKEAGGLFFFCLRQGGRVSLLAEGAQSFPLLPRSQSPARGNHPEGAALFQKNLITGVTLLIRHMAVCISITHMRCWRNSGKKRGRSSKRCAGNMTLIQRSRSVLPTRWDAVRFEPSVFRAEQNHGALSDRIKHSSARPLLNPATSA